MNRLDAVVEYVQDHPKATGDEIGRALGMTWSYAYGLLAEARRKGLVPPPDNAHPSAEAPPAAPEPPPPPPPAAAATLHPAVESALLEAKVIAGLHVLRDAEERRVKRYEAVLRVLLEGSL